MFGFAVSAIIGVCLGFLFGVGCAAAVLYTIYMGGYRAALLDAKSPEHTQRYRVEMKKLSHDFND